jgi:hypothetical protein
VSPQVKLQRIQIWRGAWRPCSVSSSAYTSVMTDETENISHSTRVPHSCSDCQWYIFQWLWRIMQEEISVVVACKSMRQDMRAYQTVTNNPCPHIDAELLLLSTWYSCRYIPQINVSGYVDTFSCLVSGNSAQNVSAPFSYILYIWDKCNRSIPLVCQRGFTFLCG